MENLDNMFEVPTDDEIGTQVNNCCADCIRLESRVTVAERDIEYLQTSKASSSIVDPLVRDVEWMNANKADKATNSQLLTDVEGLKLEKANRTELSAKADKIELALKADRSEVADKADKSEVLEVTQALENKADISFVLQQASDILRKIYPVGSYYFSAVSVDPSTIVGFGTWQRTALGRVLVGVNENDNDFDYSGKAGGDKNMQEHRHTGASHTHTVPAHIHKAYLVDTVNGSSTGFAARYDYHIKRGANDQVITSAGGGTTSAGGANNTSFTGKGKTENLQPYLTCYIWERIA